MAQTIKKAETRDNQDCHNTRGASGEKGCYQMTQPTYERYSKDTIGYIAPRTPLNETYIVSMKSEQWIRENKTSQKILLSWNAGEGATKCSKGVNKYKVKYDSCKYIKNGMDILATTAYAEN